MIELRFKLINKVIYEKWNFDFKSFEEAVQFLEYFGLFDFNYINDEFYEGSMIHKIANSDIIVYNFTFYDNETKKFIIQESPWKVGLNESFI